MDTKLKNNKTNQDNTKHKMYQKPLIAALIMAIVIAGNFLLSPFIVSETEAIDTEEASDFDSQTEEDSLVFDMISGSYILYMEQLQREQTNGTQIDSSIFLNSDVSTDTDTLTYTKEALQECITNWEIQFDETRRQLDYAVFKTTSANTDASADASVSFNDPTMLQIGEQNTSEPLSEFVTNSDDTEQISGLKETYSLIFVISYDKYGNMSVDSLYSQDGKEDVYLKAFQSIGKTDLYEEYDSSLMQNLITAPKNITMIYGIKPDSDLLAANTDSDTISADFYYYNTNVIEIYYLSLLILAITAILLVPNRKYLFPSQVQKEADAVSLPGFLTQLKNNPLAKRPFELSFIAVCILMSLSHIYFNFYHYCFIWKGWNETAICARLGGWVAFGVAILEFSVWLILVFTVWMLTFYSLGSVFQLGIKGYFKEKSWCYFAFCWLKQQWKKFRDEVMHLDLSDKTNKTIKKAIILNFIVLFILSWMWGFAVFPLIVYSLILYYLFRKYSVNIKQDYEQLLRTTKNMAEGHLDNPSEVDMGIFQPVNEQLQKVQDGFKTAVEEELKSQRMKTDLITNVSHDLKTPLTAITTYVELLKDDSITEEERKQYIDVLDRKALRLKVLIEDLFDVSKATSETMKLELVDLDIVNLIKQVGVELKEKFEAANLDLRYHVPDEKVILTLDGSKTYRIIENLFVNVTKYALPHTRVYVDVTKKANYAKISISNISAAELNFKEDEITERFVRGDVSRNTEGSGLGLAIVKSFTEAQKGSLQIKVDGDLFKAILTWPIKQ